MRALQLLISIHSPCVGRDIRGEYDRAAKKYISIHSPRVGRDKCTWSPCRIALNFNPLAPCGARRFGRLRSAVSQHFNPLAPCGARHVLHLFIVVLLRISIHSPRLGRDEYLAIADQDVPLFQSTRPVWGETDQVFVVGFRVAHSRHSMVTPAGMADSSTVTT